MKKMLMAGAVYCLWALCFASPRAAARSSDMADHSVAVVANGIGNFRQIAPGIFAGANPIDGASGERGMRTLSEHGIALDIDLQGVDVSEAPNFAYRLFNEADEPGERPEMIARERELATEVGIDFLNLSINSNNQVSSEEAGKIDQVLEHLRAATPTAPVFLHCEHGADRTGLVVALFRVLYQNQDIDAA